MFTFKENRGTGRYASFTPESHDIKVKKRVVGHIAELRSTWTEIPTENLGKFEVSLAVKKEVTKTNPAPFKWIRFKKKFDTAKEAKEWLNLYFDEILKLYPIYYFEKESK